jgi:hypothetical protein
MLRKDELRRDEDELLAIQLQQQEWSKMSRHLEKLETKATIALAKLLEAAEQRGQRGTSEARLNQLKNDYHIALSAFEEARSAFEKAKDNMQQLTARTPSSPALIHSTLQEKGMPSMPPKPHQAQALQSFSEEESEIMRTHYEKIPAELKNLFDAALNDECIKLDMITNPVFIRGDGHVYDLETVKDMLERGGKNPLDETKQFTKEDIIPCNPLIRAMQLLLEIIHNKEIIIQPVETNHFVPTSEFIKKIEAFYQRALPTKHQSLFDAICRDSYTNMIMNDPVFLPDGYAYNRDTARLLLESVKPMESAPCPRDESILFKEEDITKCYFIAAVFEYLKKIVEQRAATVVTVTEEKNSLVSYKK